MKIASSLVVTLLVFESVQTTLTCVSKASCLRTATWCLQTAYLTAAKFFLLVENLLVLLAMLKSM